MFEAWLDISGNRKETQICNSLLDAFGFAVLHLCEYGEMKPSEAKGILNSVLMIACEQLEEKDAEIEVWEVEDSNGIIKCTIKNLDGGCIPKVEISRPSNDIE